MFMNWVFHDLVKFRLCLFELLKMGLGWIVFRAGTRVVG